MRLDAAELRRPQRSPFAIFAVAIVFWLGLAAWLFYIFQSQRDYVQNHFNRFEALPGIPVYHPGEVVRFDDDRRLIWIGWSVPEPTLRWSAAKEQIGLVFRTAGTDNWKCPCQVKFHILYTRGTQHVTLLVHGKKIATSTIDNKGTLTLVIPPGNIEPNTSVGLELLLPDAGPANVNGDNRVLGIAIADVVINSSS